MAAASDGWLPLHWAAHNSHEAVARMLLDAAPAAAMAADEDGWLPLHAAADYNHEAVVRLLLDAAPVAAMAADADGRLPLHRAAAAGHEAVVRLLLDAAPQAATATTADGGTPLQIALLHGHTSSARVLLSAGPAAAVLSALAAAAAAPAGADATSLFLDFLLAPGRLPLTAANWALVPLLCPDIERALPTALACGPDQAAQVVHRLPPAEAARLRAAALCLGRHGVQGSLAALILARCL